jgi:hypothetical protein
MHPDHSAITTERDFKAFVRTLLDVAALSERTLEAYLRGVLVLVQGHCETPPSYALFGSILHDALVIVPPRENEAAGEAEDASYQRVIDLLMHQIVDLRQMREAGILDLPASDRWLGVRAPSGRTWFNYTIGDYLEPTARHLDAASDDPDEDVSWLDFDFVLRDGQYHE